MQSAEGVLLGQLATSARVLAERSPSGEWGLRIESPGRASMVQPHPVRLQVYVDESRSDELCVDYQALRETAEGLVGEVQVRVREGVSLQVEDLWSLADSAVVVRRRLVVRGDAPGGFLSGVSLRTAGDCYWTDADYFCPGVIYRSSEGLLDFAPGGKTSYEAGRLEVREDEVPMPLFGVHFRDGTSAAVLDMEPRGDTTAAESHDLQGTTLIDERFAFGALGAHAGPGGGGIDLGFWSPGTVSRVVPWPGGDLRPRWYRRYLPFRGGLAQEYRVAFRFGRDESFHQFYSQAWRWAWTALEPPVSYHDVELVRRVLVDQLAGTAVRHEDRVGFPFWCDARAPASWRDGIMTSGVWAPPGGPPIPERWRDNRATMGFVGKNLESAALLYQDSDGDPSPRGQEYRELALAVIDTFVRLLKLCPPEGEGLDIYTGHPSVTLPWELENRVFTRCLVEDLKWVLRTYRRELRQGRDHPAWLFWCWRFGAWLLTKQTADGGFPRSWRIGSEEPMETSTTMSHAPIPFLVLLSEVSGRAEFREAALRAGKFCWAEYHSRDRFIGGTPDNPNIMDKEAGTLAAEAYLALYEANHERKWLERAMVAADYAETWIWAWNMPMPEDESDEALHWKKGVSTVGANKINSTGAGVDQWMAVDVPQYAKLYAYTGDSHYLDIARILLHNTKNMLALPDRLFDLVGPGWQQEHWGMCHPRGFGAHRGWLPWVSANHLTGILSLEEFDPELYRELCRTQP